MAFVLTKAAAALKGAVELEHVKFESHKPKKRKEGGATNSHQPMIKVTKIAKAQELDLKKVRHEVVKFGMSGFDAPKKLEAKIALAVSLGAKPPRKKRQNYKELMEQRKVEKQKEKERKDAMGKDMLRISVPANKKKKKISNDVGHLLNVYGKVDKKKIIEVEQKHKAGKKRKK